MTSSKLGIRRRNSHLFVGQRKVAASQEMVGEQSPVSSSNAKSRLKWSRQLHERFVEAVSRLGGADKATPRSVMRTMGVHGLTLYHLKSHLQKYRLAIRRETGAACSFTGDGYCRTEESHNTQTYMDRNETKINESMLQLHMELQKKLHEQIEVQRHLQLRIEAQGKYLQSVLRKAQETLVGYGLDSLEVDAVDADLSELASAVDTECLTSSIGCPVQPPHADSSSDSGLTSSERPKTKDGNLCKLDAGASYCHSRGGCGNIGTDAGKLTKNRTTTSSGEGNGGCSRFCGGDCDQVQPGSGKRHSQPRENCSGVSDEIDLNR